MDDNEEIDYKRKYLELLSRLNETEQEGTLKKIKDNSMAKIKSKLKKTRSSGKSKETKNKSGENKQDKNKKATTKKTSGKSGEKKTRQGQESHNQENK